MNRLVKVALVVTLGVLAGAGCLERKEAIEIAPDGSAVLRVRASGDPDDLRQGDALPTAAAGWRVEERTEVDGEGKETLIRTAVLEVPAGGKLPGSYAAASDPVRDVALSFPTELRIERGAEGTWYHFRRVYRGRVWNAVEAHRTRLFEAESLKRIAGKDPKELAAEDRVALVHALLEFGRCETSTYLHQAWADAGEGIPQAAFLEAHAAVLATAATPALEGEAVDLLARNDIAGIVALAERLRQEARRVLTASFKASGVPDAAAAAFVERWDFHRRLREVSSDLTDETWEVTVSLPGRIRGHNSLAPEAEARPEPGRVVWRFDGKALCDRDVVLLASSFVPAGEDGGK